MLSKINSFTTVNKNYPSNRETTQTQSFKGVFKIEKINFNNMKQVVCFHKAVDEVAGTTNNVIASAMNLGDSVIACENVMDSKVSKILKELKEYGLKLQYKNVDVFNDASRKGKEITEFDLLDIMKDTKMPFNELP